MKYYEINEEDLKNLLYQAHKLTALESGGVDNWGWYGESISEFCKEVKEEIPALKDEPEVYLEDIADEALKQYKVIRED